jgi:CDP-glycerol glycerophosphotransferase
MVDGTVAYNSFWGQYSDSPRAIYEELAGNYAGPYSHLWVSGSFEQALPEGVRSAALGTKEYHRALGRAQFVVSNNGMPQFAKRPGVTYLQTWHGTPLKKIGFDNANYARNPAGLRRVARDYQQWDFLVSQNHYSTEIFRRAFRFDGEILETGYPRNDVLNSPQAPGIRRCVRRDLGISDNQTVVLYAPTYRDTHRQDGVMFPDALDLNNLRAHLGHAFVFLRRLHYSVAPLADAATDGVVDVSSYADIRDLYLAADVLITDYSSVMFDFAVTAKPIILFMSDYAAYTNHSRQHYFDILEKPPGPVCRTAPEVGDVLNDLNRVSHECSAPYEQFRRQFCYLDDGLASRRVVERVFRQR